jgi:hypothetical protein
MDPELPFGKLLETQDAPVFVDVNSCPPFANNIRSHPFVDPAKDDQLSAGKLVATDHDPPKFVERKSDWPPPPAAAMILPSAEQKTGPQYWPKMQFVQSTPELVET